MKASTANLGGVVCGAVPLGVAIALTDIFVVPDGFVQWLVFPLKAVLAESWLRVAFCSTGFVLMLCHMIWRCVLSRDSWERVNYSAFAVVSALFMANLWSSEFLAGFSFDALVMAVSMPMGYFFGQYFLTTGPAVASVAFAIAFTGYFLISIGYRTGNYSAAEVARLAGPMGNPNILGMMLAAGTVAFVLLGVSPWLDVARSGVYQLGPGLGALSLLSAMLAVCFLFRTFSRGAWVSLLLASVLIWLFQRGRWRRRQLQPSRTGPAALPSWLMAPGVVVAFALICIAFSPGWNAVVRRLGLSAAHDASIANRLAAWSDSLGIIRDHYLLGCGSANLKPIYDCLYGKVGGKGIGAIETNSFLYTGCVSGAVALAGVVYLLAAALTRTGDRESSLHQAYWPKVMLAVLAGAMTFTNGMAVATVAVPFWCLVAILVLPAPATT